MIETEWTLFNGRAGEDAAQVWLEAAGQGAVIRTQSWGPGVDRHFGSATLETWLQIDGPSLATLAHALVMDLPDLDSGGSPIETIAAAYHGDSAATSHARQRLDELDLPYEFSLR